MNPQDEKLWATLIHLSPLVAGIVGLPFLGPLIGYLVLATAARSCAGTPRRR